MLMLLVYVIMNASVISSDWINFKKSYVLKRSVVSPRSNMEIMLSFLLAYFVFIFVANMALMALMHLSGLVPEMNWGVFTGLLAVTIIYSLCLNLFFFRIFKMPGHATTFGILFVMIMSGLGIRQSSQQSGLSLRWQGSTSQQEATASSSMCKINKKDKTHVKHLWMFQQSSL